MNFGNQKIVALALLIGLVGGAYLLRGAENVPPPPPQPAAATPAPTGANAAPAPQAPPQAAAAQPQAPAAQPQAAPTQANLSQQPAQSTEQAGNLAWPSEELSNPRYKPDNASINAVADSNAPAGIKTVNRLVENDSDGLHRAEIIIDGLQPGGVYTTSLFVKPAERTAILLEVRDNDKTKKYGVARFDLQRGSTTKFGDVANAGIIALAGGWYRVWAEMPYATERGVMDFTLMGAHDAPSYAGDGKSGLLVSGFQVNPGSGPTAYVPTDLAPVAAR